MIISSKTLSKYFPQTLDLTVRASVPVRTYISRDPTLHCSHQDESVLSTVCYILYLWVSFLITTDTSQYSNYIYCLLQRLQGSRKEAVLIVVVVILTSSTTTTVSMASVCYQSGTAAFTECMGRKKRRDLPRVEEMEDKIVDPSRNELEDTNNGRVGRFFLYWITTTSISTTTTYTTTYKVSTAVCTPPGASEC